MPERELVSLLLLFGGSGSAVDAPTSPNVLSTRGGITSLRTAGGKPSLSTSGGKPSISTGRPS